MLTPSVQYQINKIDTGEYTFSKMCSITDKIYSVTVSESQYNRIKSRFEFIQDILTDKSIEQREFIISGLTPAEQDTIFNVLSDDSDE